VRMGISSVRTGTVTEALTGALVSRGTKSLTVSGPPVKRSEFKR